MSILIAGAGPAGSRLSQKLALEGIDVTLVERLKNPYHSAFSSAVIPINVIEDHKIPYESISTSWKSWQIFDPNGLKHNWTSSSDLGVILDFGKFREANWNRARSLGVELLLGWKVKSVTSLNKCAEVQLQGPNGVIEKRNVLWVIDATGNSRSLIGSPSNSTSLHKDQLIKGSGIEWVLQGDSTTSSFWGDRITFFLGTSWIKYGYCWIFPMGNNQLKVGSCTLPPDSKNKSIDNVIALKNVVKKYNLDKLPVIDRHAGVLSSTIRRKESHFCGRVIGLGDAISTANLLGGEGIRHSLVSADTLAPLLIKLTGTSPITKKNEVKILSQYKSSLRHRLGWRWNLSNRLARKTWWGLSDSRADLRLANLINGLSNQVSAEEISALLFDYRFDRYGIRLLPYLIGWR